MQYVWAVQIPNAQVSLFGLVRLRAKFLPYVNLLIDLIVGGPMYALESATGLAAGDIWFYVTGVRRPPPTSRDGRAHLDRFLAKYIAPLFETPRRVRRLITGDGAVRQRSYGTAYSPGVPPASSSKGYWWPFGPRGQTAGGHSTGLRPRAPARPDRDAIRAATEARLRKNSSS